VWVLVIRVVFILVFVVLGVFVLVRVVLVLGKLIGVVVDGAWTVPARGRSDGAPARACAGWGPGDPIRVSRELPPRDRRPALGLAVRLKWAAGLRVHACPRRA